MRLDNLARDRQAEAGMTAERFRLRPEIRFYPERGSETREAAIDSTLLRDVYLVYGERERDDKITLRLYVIPGMSFIWLGGILMVAGGGIAALAGAQNRRLR